MLRSPLARTITSGLLLGTLLGTGLATAAKADPADGRTAEPAITRPVDGIR